MRLIPCAALAAALPLSGCLAVPVAHYATTEPIRAGVVNVDGGITLDAKTPAYGLDQDNADGDGMGSHFGSAVVPELAVRYGIVDRLEVNARILPTTYEAGLRAILLEEPGLRVAAEGSIGWLDENHDADHTDSDLFGNPTQSVSVRRHYTGSFANATLGVRGGSERFAIVGGPLVTAVNFHKKYSRTVDGALVNAYDRDIHLVEPGIYVGVAMGRRVVITPGLTILAEANHYPASRHDGAWAFPWIGLTVRPRVHLPSNAPPPGEGPPPPPPPAN